jgi:hypothetical protein
MGTLIQPTRRGLFTGLGALLAAPAIVRAESLMVLRQHVYKRFVMQYQITSDTFLLRADKATHPLLIPLGVRILTEDEARVRMLPDVWATFTAMPVGLDEQKHVITAVPTPVANSLGTYPELYGPPVL